MTISIRSDQFRRLGEMEDLNVSALIGKLLDLWEAGLQGTVWAMPMEVKK